MNKDDTVYLRHILECIRRITEDTVEGRARFLASHTLQDAVLRNLQVLAEPTQRFSATLKATQPGIEWRRSQLFGTSWSMTTLVLTWRRSGISHNAMCRHCNIP
jgi:uncharacterized protein with HEPN domain